jgi:mono/diheme cytochrome c family protein
MTPGRTDPSPLNQDDPKMSDPSPRPTSLSSTLVDDPDDDASEGRSTPLPLALVLGLVKLAAVAMVVYLTYYFTTWFAHQPPPAAPLTDEQVALAKKAEDLRASGKKLLSSYGWADPVTKSKVHIPIDQAMELLLAESTRPKMAPRAQVPGPAPPPGGGTPRPGDVAKDTTAKPPGTPGPAPAPEPVANEALAGMPPEQIYRMVCMACHDADGKGKIVKLAMPAIPDLTDPKWQASRTDAELQHSILEGKESTINGVKVPLMLPMKDKLALARTEVKDMVAFMRAFKGGKQVVSGTPGPIDVANVPVPKPPDNNLPPVPPPPEGLKPASPGGPQPGNLAGNVPPKPREPNQPTPPGPQPPAPPPPQPSGSIVTTGGGLPPAIPPSPAGNPAAVAEKIRAAGSLFGTLCIACHGPDGRGTLVRVAMPPIPDFTSRDWQASRTSSQLRTSILEGKGTLMIPWNTRLTADQARELVLYVRNIGGPDLLAAEFQAEAPAVQSLAEFDNKMRSLRQQFDEVEKQLQTLPQAPAR